MGKVQRESMLKVLSELEDTVQILGQIDDANSRSFETDIAKQQIKYLEGLVKDKVNLLKGGEQCD